MSSDLAQSIIPLGRTNWFMRLMVMLCLVFMLYLVMT